MVVVCLVPVVREGVDVLGPLWLFLEIGVAAVIKIHVLAWFVPALGYGRPRGGIVLVVARHVASSTLDDVIAVLLLIVGGGFHAFHAFHVVLVLPVHGIVATLVIVSLLLEDGTGISIVGWAARKVRQVSRVSPSHVFRFREDVARGRVARLLLESRVNCLTPVRSH
jgi:hypothetical protein